MSPTALYILVAGCISVFCLAEVAWSLLFFGAVTIGERIFEPSRVLKALFLAPLFEEIFKALVMHRSGRPSLRGRIAAGAGFGLIDGLSAVLTLSPKGITEIAPAEISPFSTAVIIVLVCLWRIVPHLIYSISYVPRSVGIDWLRLSLPLLLHAAYNGLVLSSGFGGG